jgi:hypothetical protein
VNSNQHEDFILGMTGVKREWFTSMLPNHVAERGFKRLKLNLLRKTLQFLAP